MKRVIFAGIMMLLLIFSCTTEHIDSASTVVVTKTDLSGLTSATGTIKFSANSGSGSMADLTADIGKDMVLPLCSFTAPSGKKFGHWNTAADGSGYSCIDGANVKDLAAALLTAKKDNGTIITLYAQWIDKNDNRIIYLNTKNVRNPNPTSFKESDTIVLKDLTADGFIFGGWYEVTDDIADVSTDGWDAGSKIADITLWAKWSEIETASVAPVVITYTIKFDKNGGDGTMDDMTADNGTTVSLSSCTIVPPVGKKFGSWNTKADGSGVGYIDNAAVKNLAETDGTIVTLYAQWIDKDEHRIIYIDPTNMLPMRIDSFKESEDVTLETPQAATGYAFKGWYLTDNPTESDDAIIGWSAGSKTEDVILYADWETAVYAILYRDEGDAEFTGSTEGLPTSHAYSKKTSLVSPKRSSYTFIGWYLTSNCAGNRLIELGGKDVTSDITLFAKWEVCLECTVAELGALLASLDVTTDAYKIKITDSQPDQTVLRAALTSNSTKNVHLDLSECEGMTKIKQEAFKDCVNLMNVSLSDNVKSIFSGAFSGCVGLTNLVIPDTVTFIDNEVFAGCTGLTDLTLSVVGGNCTLKQMFGDSVPETLTSVTVTQSVKSNAFKDCNNLTSVKLGDDVMSIGESAFSGCSGLTEPIYNNHLFAYMPTSYSGDYEIPAGITTICDAVFQGCNKLTSIKIPTGVTSIGDVAFYECTNLRSVSIPDSVTSIGRYAFYECTNLRSIVIPNGVTSIGGYLFYGCTNLRSVSIPNSVTQIGNRAFYNCRSLISIDIPNNVYFIGIESFYNCPLMRSIDLPDYCFIAPKAFYNCSNLISVSMGGVAIYNGWISATSGGETHYAIEFFQDVAYYADYNGDSVFESCNSLVNVTVREGTTHIPDNLFRFCGNLNNVIIPDSVISIGAVFYYCSSLKSLVIPDLCQQISPDAFRSCSSLKVLTVRSAVPPNLSKAFSNYTPTAIYVPEESIDAYKTATGWENYADIIHGVAISEYNEESVTKSVGELMDYLSNLGDIQTVNITISDTNPSLADIKTALQSFQHIKVNLNLKGCAGLTSIEAASFQHCRNLIGISIPNSVTSIGNYAFSNCYLLSNVTLDNGVTSIGNYAFSNCKNLTSIEIPNSVNSIGDYAFYYCSGLTSIEIPDNVTSIGGGAFSGCSGLTSIEIPDSVTNIGSSAFYNCMNLTSIEIPDSVTSIGGGAFSGCSGLTEPVYNAKIFAYMPTSYSGSYTIPSGITSIAGSAFVDCSGLTSVTIPDSVTSIGTQAFSNCMNLTSIEIPDSVTSVGDNAFKGCTGLTSVFINSDVDLSKAQLCFIKDNIKYCLLNKNSVEVSYYEYVGNIVIPNTVSSSGYTFAVTSIGEYAFGDCSGLTSITIPDSVTSIGSEAFWGCSGLTSVIIPNSVTSIGGWAFQDCSGLTSVTIPNSVTSIGEFAFQDCSGLTSVIIPNSVTSIGFGAFAGCSDLTTLTVKATTPPTFGSDMLADCSALTTIYVPADSVDAYKAADGWSAFASKITAIPEP